MVDLGTLRNLNSKKSSELTRVEIVSGALIGKAHCHLIPLPGGIFRVKFLHRIDDLHSISEFTEMWIAE